MAAAVSNAGALGALGLGAATPAKARHAIELTQSLTDKPFNVNVFCHTPARRNTDREGHWLQRTKPLFAEFGAQPPARLREIYPSFTHDEDACLEVLLHTRPRVVSFHFGLPRPDQAQALRRAGCLLVATATCLKEAHAIVDLGLDAIVAQGWEAGGHRGVFDPDAPDDQLSTKDLTLQLAQAHPGTPLIAAGGLMTGADLHRARAWGAGAAQLGTAFVPCPESDASPAHKARLGPDAHTVMTRAISGRPARALYNRFTAWEANQAITPSDIPAYPCAYDLGKALDTIAQAHRELGYGAHWAGTASHHARALPAHDLVALLTAEWRAASSPTA
ncbi:uncharacterized protein MONBRDRAFT_12798 [Monosiga brevicollis MX1]|uniref:Nitronate monooxygenase domain-containing protein n=1 Tax=Monosiga brevicollis TaxID=81824 RepID=A9VDB7_MONBE|nr:uncharacterized protein MONBRDRAFT_12798 [Monosiga brevicollis MX1]EDQ84450.1 predicted protein [Monosiga brevicollis MX1]|eukprot:XP_001750745.1 hypothetical protein [Monosiga brevicollis MX1]